MQLNSGFKQVCQNLTWKACRTSILALGVAIALPEMGGLKVIYMMFINKVMQVAIALPEMGGLKVPL